MFLRAGPVRVRVTVLLGLAVMWPSPARAEPGPATVSAPGDNPLLSDYELDACAVAMADALRLSRLVVVSGGPVRLLPPVWTNSAGLEVGDADALVRKLCARIDQASGAAVAFETVPASESPAWGDAGARRLATRLSLEKGRKRRTVELVLQVTDPAGATLLVEVRRRLRLPRKRLDAERSETRQPAVENHDQAEERPHAERPGPADPPTGERSRPARGREPREQRQTRAGHRIRKCRLPHFWAMPEDEGVEREVELDCGRLLFLDRKAADRLVHLSDTCSRLPDGALTVEVELACRKKKRGIEIWAEFFDARGRGVNRTRTQTKKLREGQIRVVTLDSVIPAEQVVVFIDDD